MLAHMVLCQALRVLVGWRSNLALELFAVPNAAIAPDWGFRLLRARYYILWKAPPDEMEYESLFVRFVYFLTRVSGLLMPFCMLFFFVLVFANIE